MERPARGEGGGAKLSTRDNNTTYASALLQLLDLLDALYSKVGRIFNFKTLAVLKESMDTAAQDSVVQDGGVSGQEGYCPDVDSCGENARPEVMACPEVGEGILMWNIAWCPLLQGKLFPLTTSCSLLGSLGKRYRSFVQ